MYVCQLLEPVCKGSLYGHFYVDSVYVIVILAILLPCLETDIMTVIKYYPIMVYRVFHKLFVGF